MTALEKFREQVRIARETINYVVQTAAEAQAVLDEIDGVPPAVAAARPLPIAPGGEAMEHAA